MALKLKVPWRTEPLPVSARRTRPYLKVIDKIKQSGSPYVREDGNDALVMDFFKDNNKVPDVIRYRIDAGDHGDRYRIYDDRFIIPISCCIVAGGKCVPHDVRYHICGNRFTIPRGNHPGQADSHCDIYGSALEQLLQQQQLGNIVLLLESPHESEFIYTCYGYFDRPFTRPKAPACGSTGESIDRCLGTVLEMIREIHIAATPNAEELIVPECHIIISNPIQLQTSLHAIHGQELSKKCSNGKWARLRDKVWKTLWAEEHIKACFLERLTAYNPRLIINACTGSLPPGQFLNCTNELTLKHGLTSVPTIIRIKSIG